MSTPPIQNTLKTKNLSGGGTLTSGTPSPLEFQQMQASSNKPEWLLRLQEQWHKEGKIKYVSILEGATGSRIVHNSNGVHIDSPRASDTTESSFSASSSTSSSSTSSMQTMTNQLALKILKPSTDGMKELGTSTSTFSSSPSTSISTNRSISVDYVAHVRTGEYMQGGTSGAVTFNNFNGKIEFNYNLHWYDLDTPFPGEYWIYPGSKPAQLKVTDPRGSSYFIEARTKESHTKSHTVDSLAQNLQGDLMISSDVSLSSEGTFADTAPPGWFLPLTPHSTSVSIPAQENSKLTDTNSASIPATTSTSSPPMPFSHSEVSDSSSSSQSHSTLEVDKSHTFFSNKGDSMTSGTFKPGSVFTQFQVYRGPGSTSRTPLIPLVDEVTTTACISTLPSTISPLSQPLKSIVFEKTKEGVHLPSKNSIPHLEILGIYNNKINLQYFDVKYSLNTSVIGKYSLKCDPLSKKVQAMYPNGTKAILKPSE